MTNGTKKRPKINRVAPLDLPPGTAERIWNHLRRPAVLGRLVMCISAAVAIWALTGAWAPPYSFREGFVPQRDIAAQLMIRVPNPTALEEARKLARDQAPWVYRQDPKELELLQAALVRVVTEIATVNSFAELNKDTWKEFQLPMPGSDAQTIDLQEEAFEEIRGSLKDDPNLEQFTAKLRAAFETDMRNGLLERLPDEHKDGNQKEIAVYPIGRPHDQRIVEVSEVLIGDAADLQERLKSSLPRPLAERCFHWLRPRLKSTLVLDQELSLAARDAAAAAVPPDSTDTLIQPGDRIAQAGVPLNAATLKVLELEHRQNLQQMTWPQKLSRSIAVLGMLAAAMALCGYYVYSREPRLLDDARHLGTILVMTVVVVAVMPLASVQISRVELIPLLVFGMTLGIAFQPDVAIVVSLASAGVMVMCGGLELGEFFILGATVTAAIVQLGRIRSRSKLIKVGAVAAVVGFLATVGVGLLQEQPLWLSTDPFQSPLLVSAGLNALWTFLAGFLLTGLLPMIESYFGVLTEISLLEWGDVTHPLLQELVRRAPGTYNHSINVASLAEAAAEAVGARGLLVRVGAYFHDIGKMLKPDYFAENQIPGENRHDTLVPALSTLIIIAHVKDGADLARQHDLPEPLIDFIEQHHGTTLVEYFFRRASQQNENESGGQQVPESDFRYPGPKPQTIEAAVLMMADAAESASRTLVEPTPSRLEALVEKIAENRLLDDQFSECGLTLEQLHTIQESLVKSLTAVYHGRIKYPSQQQTA